jgi:hypothetical protein
MQVFAKAFCESIDDPKTLYCTHLLANLLSYLINMATKTGEEYSTKSQELLKMMDEYSVGVFGAVPSFVVSGKGSTLVVGRTMQSFFNGSVILRDQLMS